MKGSNADPFLVGSGSKRWGPEWIIGREQKIILYDRFGFL
jgi:hypothetical protein